VGNDQVDLLVGTDDEDVPDRFGSTDRFAIVDDAARPGQP
jgi:hypothetical protein